MIAASEWWIENKYTSKNNLAIKVRAEVPPILIATADRDYRVVPAHAKKVVPTLREKADKDTTIILRLEAKATHGIRKPTSKIINKWVDVYAFLDKE